MKKLFFIYFLIFLSSFNFVNALIGFTLFDDEAPTENTRDQNSQLPNMSTPNNPLSTSVPQVGQNNAQTPAPGTEQNTVKPPVNVPGTQQQPIVNQAGTQPSLNQKPPTSTAPVNPGPLMFKGCFTIKGNQEKIPSFRIYFEGKEIKSDEEGFFSIPVDEDRIDKFKIIMSKTLHQNFDQHNTIKNFNLVPEKNYLCYSFKKRGPFNNSWAQREKNLAKKQFVIPKNSIVILLDPKYVDHLEPWNINLTHNFIKLPKIVLKKEVKNKSIERAAAKSLLNALDTSPFHEEVREVAQIDPNNQKIKITAPQ